jgi:hypothetical protein
MKEKINDILSFFYGHGIRRCNRHMGAKLLRNLLAEEENKCKNIILKFLDQYFCAALADFIFKFVEHDTFWWDPYLAAWIGVTHNLGLGVSRSVDDAMKIWKEHLTNPYCALFYTRALHIFYHEVKMAKVIFSSINIDIPHLVKTEEFELMFQLAHSFYEGVIVEKNFDIAISYLSIPFLNSHAHAQYVRWIISPFPGDNEYLLKCSRQNYIEGCSKVMRFTNFHHAVDIKESYDAIVSFAIHDECAWSQNALGFLYENGNPILNILPDLKESFKWFHKSATNNYPTAQINTGICFQTGDGVARDFNMAIFWQKKAAEKGEDTAIKWLERYNVIVPPLNRPP